MKKATPSFYIDNDKVGIDRKLEGALRSISPSPSPPNGTSVGIDRKLEGALRYAGKDFASIFTIQGSWNRQEARRSIKISILARARTTSQPLE